MKTVALEAISPGEIMKGLLRLVDLKSVLFVNPKFLNAALSSTNAKADGDGRYYAPRFNLYIEPDDEVKYGVIKRL